ncbi:MAG TPA: phasin family protein [Beijerinckiaceae bacterium]|jgi:hypothetical protein
MKDEKTSRAAGAKAPAKRAPKAVAKAVGVPVKAVAKSPAKSPDPRSVPAPTAPASVARKAAEAIAPVASVATAEPKKAEKAEAVKAAAPAPGSNVVSLPGAAPLAAAFEAGAGQARAAYARARETGDGFREAATASTAASARGFLELNGKVIDLVRAQNDAALDLWRSTLTAGSLSEAIRAQTHGLREAYETTAAGWKDLAETAGRLMGEAAKPLRSAFTQGR